MTHLVVDSFLYDIGVLHNSADDFVDCIIEHVRSSWDSGADLVVLPEYVWGPLKWIQTPHLTVEQWANTFWLNYMPRILSSLSRQDKAVILGSAPILVDGEIRNRAPIICNGAESYQDKLCLTPWESILTGGSEINIFEFKGFKIATLICLDSEIPATADLLKRLGGLDLLLVPSATESLVGVERIARCCSARSVELSCAVIVAQITGGIGDDYLGNNLGQASLYLPSLNTSADLKRIDERGIASSGTGAERFVVDLDALHAGRNDLVNTNPALVSVEKDIKIKLSNKS